MWRYVKYVVYAVFLASIAYYLSIPFSHSAVDKAFISGGIVVLTDVLLTGFGKAIKKAVRDERARYELKVVASYVLYIIALSLVLFLWLDNPQTVVLAVGIIGAGLVVVFQDVLMSIAAFAYILVAKPFSVGDRIEVDGRAGDVIDIGAISIKLMEIKGWVKADQGTGRLVMVPNNVVFKSQVVNYTKDFNFIWDEISVPVTYGSDWKRATKIMLEIAAKKQLDTEKMAAAEFRRLTEKYFLKKRELEPRVYMELTDNWINLTLRYVVPALERRKIHNEISMELLERLEREKKIEIASETVDVTLRG
jgi:small-conductance mechanosensitive channel